MTNNHSDSDDALGIAHVPAMGNLLAGLPSVPPAAESFETLASKLATGVSIQRIVSYGHSSPPDFWYDQADAEWVMLVQGEAILQFEGRPDLHLRAGDYCEIAAHLRHRVAWTAPDQPTVWLAVFF